MNSVFPLRDPAFTTFFGDKHFGHSGGIDCWEWEKSVRSVGNVFLDFDLVVWLVFGVDFVVGSVVVDFILGMLMFMV